MSIRKAISMWPRWTAAAYRSSSRGPAPIRNSWWARRSPGCGNKRRYCLSDLKETRECQLLIPGKVGGAWVFRDSRMPVQLVFENLDDGMSIDEITEPHD